MVDSLASAQNPGSLFYWRRISRLLQIFLWLNLVKSPSLDGLPTQDVCIVRFPRHSSFFRTVGPQGQAVGVARGHSHHMVITLRCLIATGLPDKANDMSNRRKATPRIPPRNSELVLEGIAAIIGLSL
jgi:hypothetical protein